MIKTHEKSKFELLRGDEVKSTARVVVQIDTTAQYKNGNYGVYICETVAKEDFDLSTLEVRLAAAEKQLEDEMESARIEAETAEAHIMALEELLAEANDARQGLRDSIAAIRTENKALYDALVECRRVFGPLPPEIESMIAKGE